MFEELNTRTGKATVDNRWNENVTEITYEANISRVEADEFAERYRTEIEKCQDTLDAFNATEEIDFEE